MVLATLMTNQQRRSQIMPGINLDILCLEFWCFGVKLESYMLTVVLDTVIPDPL